MSNKVYSTERDRRQSILILGAGLGFLRKPRKAHDESSQRWLSMRSSMLRRGCAPNRPYIYE